MFKKKLFHQIIILLLVLPALAVTLSSFFILTTPQATFGMSSTQNNIPTSDSTQLEQHFKLTATPEENQRIELSLPPSSNNERIAHDAQTKNLSFASIMKETFPFSAIYRLIN